MAQLTSYERETIIRFDDSSDQATIYTCNQPLIRKLGKLASEFPDAFTMTKKDECSVTYQAPKNLISIRKPTSEATREAARQRALQSNLGRKT